MKGYGQFCPVAVASEVFAQRWTPLIIRELCSGRSHFNEIHRGIPLISRTLLAERLRWLESAGVIASTGCAPRTSARVPAHRIRRGVPRHDRCVRHVGTAMVGARRSAQPRRRFSDVAAASSARSRAAAGTARRGAFLVQRRAAQAARSAQLTGWCWSARTSSCASRIPVTKWTCAWKQICVRSRTCGWAMRRWRPPCVSARSRLAGPRKLVQAFPSWLLLSRFAGVPRP